MAISSLVARGVRICGLLGGLMLLATGCTLTEDAEETAASSSLPAVAPSKYASFLAARHATAINDFRAAEDFTGKVLDQDFSSNDLIKQQIVLTVINGDVAAAAALAQKAAQADPASSIAQAVLATVAMQQGRGAEAAAALERTEDGTSTLLLKPMLLTWAYAQDKKLERAQVALAPLQKEKSFSSLYAFNRALLHALNGEHTRAVERFAATENPATLANLRYARLAVEFYLANQAPEQAERIIHQFQRARPDSLLREDLIDLVEKRRTPLPLNAMRGFFENLYDLSAIFMTENRTRQGLFYAQLARHLMPDDPVILLYTASLFEALGRFDEANRLYQGQPLTGASRYMADINTAANLEEMKQTDAALALLDDLHRRYPEAYEPISVKGDILRTEGKFAEAAAAYTQAITLIPTLQKKHWTLFYARGIALERAGNFADAEGDLKRALELSPDQPYILNYLGYSWIDRGLNTEQALAYVQKAAQLEPLNGFIVDSVGWAFYKLGRFDEAIPTLERAVRLRGQDPVIVDHLGDAYWQGRRQNEARYMWQQALALKPDDTLRARLERKLKNGL